jgi:cytochrome c nitrite reductase small subunit
MRLLKSFSILLGSFLVLIFLIGNYLISNPKTCTVCHEMKKYYETWKASSHSTAAKTCTHCHAGEEIKDKFLLRFYIVAEFITTGNSKQAPRGIYIPHSDSCARLGCHSLNRVRNPSNTIKIDHRLHTQQMKVSCVECHKQAVHSRSKSATEKNLL